MASNDENSLEAKLARLFEEHNVSEELSAGMRRQVGLLVDMCRVFSAISAIDPEQRINRLLEQLRDGSEERYDEDFKGVVADELEAYIWQLQMLVSRFFSVFFVNLVHNGFMI